MKYQKRIKKIGKIKYYVISIVLLCSVIFATNASYFIITIIKNKDFMSLTAFLLSVLTLIITCTIAALIAFVETRGYRHLRKLTYFDNTTNLYNISRFLYLAEKYMVSDIDKRFCVIQTAVNSFNVINQRYGSALGDDIVMVISNSLKLKENIHLPTRLDSENFVFIIEECSKEKIETFVTDFLNEIKNKFRQEKGVNIEFDSGACIYSTDIIGIRDMLDKSKIAKASAKDNGKTLAFFDEKVKNEIIEEGIMIDNMLSGLIKGEFKVYYQPKYNINSREMIGVEALIRWHHHKNGYIAPGKFIPIAEKKNILTQIDNYVFEQVCKDIKKWKSNGQGVYVPVSVNCESNMLASEDIFAKRFKVMETYDIKNSDIEFEITERNAINDYQRAFNILNEVKKKGCVVSIDDFGSGYSSLSMLRTMPISSVKLDKGFVKRIMLDESDRKIVSSLVEICDKLGLDVIAEGIETLEELAFVKKCGVVNIQGFLLDFPLKEEVLYARFKANNISITDKNIISVIQTEPMQKAERSEDINSSFHYRNILIKSQIDFLEVDITGNQLVFNSFNLPDKDKDRFHLIRYENFLESANSYDDCLNFMVKNLVLEGDQKRIIKFLSRQNVINELKNGNNRIKTQFRLFENDVNIVWAEISVVIIDDNGRVYAIIKYRNINKEKEKELKLIQNSTLDPLTGIYNRAEIKEQITEFLSNHWLKEKVSAFILLDLDHFKIINDTRGHIFGDMVLRENSKRIKKLFVRDEALMGRIGGDEFVIFIKNKVSKEEILNLLTEMLVICRIPISEKEKEINLNFSMGAVIVTDNLQDYDELYYKADTALQQAKKKGKACYVLYQDR